MGAPDPIDVMLRSPSIQILGEVVAIDAGTWRYTVQCDGQTWQAQRAASCLIAPALGDEVLLSGPDAARIFLIAVTRQRDAACAQIAVPGDLRIAAAGTLSLQGDVVSMDGQRTVALTAPDVTARGERMGCTFGELDLVGGQARVGVDHISVVGRVCEVVMDRLSHLANSMFRLTRDTEQSRAGHLDMQAQHTVRLHAEHTLVTAKDLVKVDANQIHMG